MRRKVIIEHLPNDTSYVMLVACPLDQQETKSLLDLPHTLRHRVLGNTLASFFVAKPGLDNVITLLEELGATITFVAKKDGPEQRTTPSSQDVENIEEDIEDIEEDENEIDKEISFSYYQ